MPENNQLLYATQFQDAVMEVYKSPRAPLLQLVDRSLVKNFGERQIIPIINKLQNSDDLEKDLIARGRGDSGTNMSSTTDTFWNTQLTPISSRNRINQHKTFAKATLVSQFDTMKEVSDPTQKYMTVIREFIEHKLNRIVLEALTASVIEENTGASAGTKSAADKKLPASSLISGLISNSPASIFEGLRQGKVKFDKNYVNLEDRFFVCNAETASSLLYHENAASQLYASSLGVKSENGDLKGILGFKVIQEENFKDADTVGILVQRKAVALGMLQDIKTDISDRPDKNLAKQLYVTFTAGAVRVYDEGVVRLEGKPGDLSALKPQRTR